MLVISALFTLGFASAAQDQIKATFLSNGVTRTFYSVGNDFSLQVPENVQNGTITFTVPSGGKRTFALPVRGLFLTLKSETDNGIEQVLVYDVERQLNATEGKLVLRCLNKQTVAEVEFEINFILHTNSAMKFIFSIIPLAILIL